MFAAIHEVSLVGVKRRVEIDEVETVGVHTPHGACGGNDEEKGAAQEPATVAPTIESGTPDLPANTPTPPAVETVPGYIDSAARKLLADELDVDEGDFRLVSSEGVGWPDASMGCPQEGMMYAQVITPGYKLVFDHAGTSQAVHTNFDGSHMVICRDGR